MVNDMSNCEYCQGDPDGFVTPLPQKEGKGKAYIFDSFWGAKLEISLPYKKRNVYLINYCPMCGKKLRGGLND